MVGFGIGLLIFIVALVLFSMRNRLRMKKLMNSRKNLSREAFVASFSKTEEEKKMVDSIYQEILDWHLPFDSFLIHPGDSFVKDYRSDEDDTESFIRVTGKKFDIHFEEVMGLFGGVETSEMTVEVLVNKFLEVRRSRN